MEARGSQVRTRPGTEPARWSVPGGSGSGAMPRQERSEVGQSGTESETNEWGMPAVWQEAGKI